MPTKDLDNVKAEVQKILDKHLEENQRFSIQDLDEESTFILIDFLIEKDEIEREKIWAKFQNKISDLEIDLKITYNSILEIKDKIDFQKNEVKDLTELKEGINNDYELNNQLSNI